LEHADRVTKVERERHPVRVDDVGVEREHLSHPVDGAAVLRLEVHVEDTHFAAAAPRLEAGQMHRDARVLSARAREVYARKRVEGPGDALLRGLQHVDAQCPLQWVTSHAAASSRDTSLAPSPSESTS